jgi:hypothetical protein
MYEIADDYIFCGEHGERVPAAFHLYVKNGDPNNLEHGWMVCLKCAQRMDRDPKFRARARPAFEEFQRRLKEFLNEQAAQNP